MTDAPRYASLRDYLRVMRSQKLLILVVAALGGFAALVISARQTPVYSASAAISFQDESQDLSLLGTAVGGGTAPEQTPQARAQTIDDVPTLLRVQRALKTKESLTQLRSHLSTTVDSKSYLVKVNADAGTGGYAARLANEFARQAALLTNRDARQRYSRAAGVLRRRLSRTPNNTTQAALLSEQLTRLQFLGNFARPAHVVEVAGVPGAPVSPKPVRNTGLGLFLGLALGLLAAFVRDSLDRRLRSSHEIQAEVKLPLLGHIREQALGQTTSADAGVRLDASDLEAFRILRQNLRYLDVDRPPRSVLVTSPLPQEGKSTVATCLAGTMAVGGARVLLVECDLRRPVFAERIRLSRAPGLSDLILGQAGPQDVLQTCPVGQGWASDANARNGNGSVASVNLWCIAAGTPSPQPAELLGSDRFKTLLGEMTDHFDLVVLDTSPLLPVADTLELVPLVDAVLLCVRSSSTTRDQAHAAKAAIEHFPARPTGLVITGISAGEESYYGYYPYAYSYAAAGDPS